MNPEVLNSLLIAQFSDGSYANGCFVEHHIVTARHVAEANPLFIHTPSQSIAKFNYDWSEKYDLAMAKHHSSVAGLRYIRPNLGEELVVIGYHGPQRKLYQIRSKVVEIFGSGEVVVERKRGESVFQLGMSGSPGVIDTTMIGILARKWRDRNTQVVLEPVLTLESQ